MSRPFDPNEAVDFIFKKSAEYATAKSDRVYLHEFRKSKKAILAGQFEGKGTIADKDNFAYSHKKYLKLLDGLRIAIEKEEKLRYEIEAAKLRIEIWRTNSANARKEYEGAKLT